MFWFPPLPDSSLEQRHEQAFQRRAEESNTNNGSAVRQQIQHTTEIPADHKLEHLLRINEDLGKYNASFMGPRHLDCLIHLDTDDLQNVYMWRLDQEDALRRRMARLGMTEQGMINFLTAYMPAYELYLDELRSGIFEQEEVANGAIQVRVCLDLARDAVEFGRV